MSSMSPFVDTSPSHEEAPYQESWEHDIPAVGVAARTMTVDHVPLLAAHRGKAPDLVLGWNDMASVPPLIDVVVHLHGFSVPKLDLRKNIEPYSGLELAPPPKTSGSPRARPTLTVLPRGDDTGVKQQDGDLNVYRFPALTRTNDGLFDLCRFSLERFASEVGATAPKINRLLLTAHSGGTAALVHLLCRYRPHQVHVFDGLYGDPDELIAWAHDRIRRDRDEVAKLDPRAARSYMENTGGALRVFYRPRTGTEQSSKQLRDAIASELVPGLKDWYRVEGSTHNHFDVPKDYGWRLLADASADVPKAAVEAAKRRELELEEALEDESIHEDELEHEPSEATNESFEDTELYGAEVASWRSPWADGRSPVLLEDQITPPPAAGVSGGGPARQVLLVAGFDYERSGVDFDSIALHRMELLIKRHAASAKAARSTTAQIVDTAPRFIVADVKSGRIRRRTMNPAGTWEWSDLATFDPVSAANYSPIAGSRRKIFNTGQAGRMSITDIYKCVQDIGKAEPGTLGELSFLGHGWIGGPILVNSDEGDAYAAMAERNPDDHDPRARKDFRAPTMDDAARANFRAAFHVDGFSWVWGCAFAAPPHQLLHFALSSRVYRTTKLGAVKDDEVIRLQFTRDFADHFYAHAPFFFPVPAAGTAPTLAFDRTFAQIKEYLRLTVATAYCTRLATASGVPCFGALPGTYADYEKGVSLPVMVIPTRVPPYSDNFERSIQFYTTYFGLALDGEGRNYGRYDPAVGGP